jgi:hypothetical protein
VPCAMLRRPDTMLRLMKITLATLKSRADHTERF